jgi:Universal stress protein family
MSSCRRCTSECRSATTNRFEGQLQRLVEVFDGPFAIGFNAARPTDKLGGPLNILVPTGGSPEARLATEIALSLAGASDGMLTALHVFDPQDDTALLRGAHVAKACLFLLMRDGWENGAACPLRASP